MSMSEAMARRYEDVRSPEERKRQKEEELRIHEEKMKRAEEWENARLNRVTLFDKAIDKVLALFGQKKKEKSVAEQVVQQQKSNNR